MAVNVDATTASGAWTTSTPFSFSHTTGSGSNRLMIVFLATQINPDAGPTGPWFNVTYNGSALTEYLVSPSDVTRATGCAIWYLLAPASGAHTFQAETTRNLYGSWAVVMTFDGVDQTTPLASPVSACYSTAASNETITTGTITGATGDIFIAGFETLSQNPGSYGSGGGQTSRGLQTDFVINNNVAAGFDTKAGSASDTLSWTTDAGSAWYRSYVGAAVKAAAGGGGGGPSGLHYPLLGLSQAVARSVTR